MIYEDKDDDLNEESALLKSYLAGTVIQDKNMTIAMQLES